MIFNGWHLFLHFSPHARVSPPPSLPPQLPSAHNKHPLDTYLRGVAGIVIERMQKIASTLAADVIYRCLILWLSFSVQFVCFLLCVCCRRAVGKKKVSWSCCHIWSFFLFLFRSIVVVIVSIFVSIIIIFNFFCFYIWALCHHHHHRCRHLYHLHRPCHRYHH